MKIIAQTNQQTTASPKAIFRLWANVDLWASYDQSINWAKLEDDFTAGSRYTIKPKSGPAVKATILTVKPNQRFDGVSHLPGAKLRFDHIIDQRANRTTISIIVSIGGPTSWLWAKILGETLQADIEQSTARLIIKAEKQP